MTRLRAVCLDMEEAILSANLRDRRRIQGILSQKNSQEEPISSFEVALGRLLQFATSGYHQQQSPLEAILRELWILREDVSRTVCTNVHGVFRFLENSIK